MKIRKGFVSNSSSTSFTCDVCGETVSGWDMCLSDSGMVECQYGHTICEEHILDKNDLLDSDETKYIEDQYGDRFLKNEYCPICALQVIMDSDLLNYVIAASGKTREEYITEIQKNFITYDGFTNFITIKKETK